MVIRPTAQRARRGRRRELEPSCQAKRFRQVVSRDLGSIKFSVTAGATHTDRCSPTHLADLSISAYIYIHYKGPPPGGASVPSVAGSTFTQSDGSDHSPLALISHARYGRDSVAD